MGLIRPDAKGSRGSGAHQLVDEANHYYLAHSLALIERCEPPAIRTKDGMIAGRGNVDYRGGVKLPGLPAAITVAFDLKATERNWLDLDPGHISDKAAYEAIRTGHRPKVKSKVPPHQVEFLTDAMHCGLLSFWLVQFTKLRRHFVLPHDVFLEYYTKQAGYKIPLEVFEQRAIEVSMHRLNPLHYLAAVPALLERLHTAA